MTCGARERGELTPKDRGSANVEVKVARVNSIIPSNAAFTFLLLADAELAKDRVQNVFRRCFPHDFAHGIGGNAQVHSREFNC
jgi:hypothetical protein